MPPEHDTRSDQIYLPRGLNGFAFDILSWWVARQVGGHPYAERYKAAWRWASRFAPLLAANYRIRRATVLGPVQARALAGVLLMLHYRGVRFPAPVTLELTTPVVGPLLILCRHNQLNQLVVRELVAQGHPVSVVMSRVLWQSRALGSDLPVTVIHAHNRMRLRHALEHLRAGRIVFGAIDNDRPEPGYGITVVTGQGPWYLSDQMIRLAMRFGIPVVACTTSASAAGIHGRLMATDLSSTDTATPCLAVLSDVIQ